MNEQKIISSEFPCESRYVTVNNFKIHYVEAGSNDPLLSFFIRERLIFLEKSFLRHKFFKPVKSRFFERF